MSIQLRLDPEALAALYHEGTQARVELQNAVIAEFMKKHFRTSAMPPVVSELLRRLEKQMNEVYDETLRTLGAKRDDWGTVKLEPTLKRSIADHVEAELNSFFKESTNAATDRIRETIHQTVQEAVARLVDEEIKAALKVKLANALDKV